MRDDTDLSLMAKRVCSWALDKIREVSVLVETKASHTDDLFSYNDTN
jgi:hypothetical protein